MNPQNQKLLALLFSLILASLCSIYFYQSSYSLPVPKVKFKLSFGNSGPLILNPEGRRLQFGPTRQLEALGGYNKTALRYNKTIQLDSSVSGTVNETKNSEENKNRELLPKCTAYNPVGPIYVDTSPVEYSVLEKKFPWVKPGGFSEPEDCQAETSTAIIVPFRDREGHLMLFLRSIHQLLYKQKLRYRIFVIEQNDVDQPFNRGMLMNVGFTEALKRGDFDCFIFHDVDLLPEDDRNIYSCPTSPRHMSVAVSTMNYILQYTELFGGVEAFWKYHFLMVNGFPNRYWGWGGEDDDLYQRVIKHRFRLTRPASTVARYKMIKHDHKPGIENPARHDELRVAWVKADKDGLNTLKYKTIRYEERSLHTVISVSLEET